MLFIEVEGDINVSSENNSACIYYYIPESPLKKNNISMVYHGVCWASSAKYSRKCFEKGRYNMAEIITKNL